MQRQTTIQKRIDKAFSQDGEAHVIIESDGTIVAVYNYLRREDFDTMIARMSSRSASFRIIGATTGGRTLILTISGMR